MSGSRFRIPLVFCNVLFCHLRLQLTLLQVKSLARETKNNECNHQVVILKCFCSVCFAGKMVNLVAFAREHWVNILVPMGFVIGIYLDRRQDEKLTAFRNKSLLYRRDLKPEEEVTWK
uniref:NADH dehydrogenase [ubiquinone] 1 beta subcomplex subunit 1 n=1 Tax=Neogobius melanostomus TaxID=47308 RepID=A0A8C6S4F9_9GOBI